jgi:hypothetical protein
VAKQTKSFFFTMTRNQIEHHWPGRVLSGGYVEVKHCKTMKEAERFIWDKFGAKWSFGYEDLSKIHELDRNLLQVFGEITDGEKPEGTEG